MVENITDRIIGDIFGLKKYQITYQRRKNNLENIFIKKIITQKELFKSCLEDKNFDINNLTSEISYKTLKIYAKGKGWRPEIVDKYLMEEYAKYDNKENYDSTKDYKVEITKSNIISKEISVSKKSKARKCNHLKNNIVKFESEKLGENIVLQEEKRKLKEKNLFYLSTKVKSVTTTKEKI